MSLKIYKKILDFSHKQQYGGMILHPSLFFRTISSSGCTDSRDNLHFNAEGYRKFGKRYAAKMLSLLGVKIIETE